LSAVVCGQVYSSPTRNAIYSTIVSLKSRDILLIVKNYTGDRINFGLAAEMAHTVDGKRVETVVVADDVALLHTGVEIGARGIAGVVMVHKITGAAAASGRTLQQVKEIATSVASLVKTYGVSLSSCTLPSSSTPMFEMESGHMEIGLGIHGEKGLGSTAKLSADEIVTSLLTTLTKHISSPSSHTPIAVLLNNLGSTTQMEMGILARAVIRQLSHLGYRIERFYSGQALTAMETAGISISILTLADPIFLELLDAPTTMPAWLALGTGKIHIEHAFVDESIELTSAAGSIAKRNSKTAAESGIASPDLCFTISKTLASVCQMLMHQEAFLTDLDSKVGDGDLGTNLAIAAADILRLLPLWSTTHPTTLLRQLALQLDESLGGTSGPLYSIFFLNLANALQKSSSPSITSQDWATAAKSGATGITSLGGAKKGDRTMMDALLPAIDALGSGGDITAASTAASAGSTGTSEMLPKKGRSSYLQERALGVVDPGSAAVALIFAEIAKTLEPH